LAYQHVSRILQGPAGPLDSKRPGKALEKEPVNDGVELTASIPTGKEG